MVERKVFQQMELSPHYLLSMFHHPLVIMNKCKKKRKQEKGKSSRDHRAARRETKTKQKQRKNLVSTKLNESIGSSHGFNHKSNTYISDRRRGDREGERREREERRGGKTKGEKRARKRTNAQKATKSKRIVDKNYYWERRERLVRMRKRKKEKEREKERKR